MGSEWVDGGPSLGSALSGVFGKFTAAPGQALNNMAMADKIAWDRRVKLANIKASEAYPDALPPAEAAPRTMPVVGPFTGDPTDPGTTAGLPRVPVQYIDPADQRLAENQRKLAAAGGSATLLEHPELWAPQLGFGRVASRGRAATANDRAEDTFLTTGRYPTADESKLLPAQNLTAVNADGSPTGITVATRNGTHTLEGDSLPSLLKPGQRFVETGSAAAMPGLTEDVAKQRLAVLANNSRNRDLTPEEQFTVQTLAPVAYKASRVTEESNGLKQEKYVHTEEIPPIVVQMMGRANMLQTPVNAPAARAAILDAAAPTPGSEGPVAPTSLPSVAAAATPIIEAADAAAAFNPNASRVTATMAGDPGKIRDDVVKAKPVVQYLNSISAYNSVVDAATQPATNATDLNIIYGLAKILDPESAVLGGELKLAASTGTAGQQVEALFNRLKDGTGMLAPDQRADLVEQARVRMSHYNEGKDQVVNYYANTVAPQQRVDPKLAVPAMPEMKQFTREQILKAGGASAPAPTGPRAARAQEQKATSAPTTPGAQPKPLSEILKTGK